MTPGEKRVPRVTPGVEIQNPGGQAGTPGVIYMYGGERVKVKIKKKSNRA